MPKRLAIGIDLGTTNSCVGVFRDGRVDIIGNDLGNKTTPSRVAFEDNVIHVGEAAKAQAMFNPTNTVFEAKRLIGLRFEDDAVQKNIEQWPFKVFDDNGAPKIKVNFDKRTEVYTPEQISSMVLKMMKKIADSYTMDDIKDAVITIPAYFGDSQRQATIDAGMIAGLNVLSIINEPTAAALAFGYARKNLRNQTVMIFDLGGGTFDVSIVSIADKEFTVRATGGDTHLGGSDFDTRLVNHFLKIAEEKHNTNLSKDSIYFTQLRESCEKAKIQLSTSSGFQVPVFVLGMLNGKHFKEILTRSKFEELCLDLFKKTIEHVKSTLNDAGMNKNDIEEVILVGGSTRIPKIQELLREFFDGKRLNTTINPDEAVAYGATLRAALASGEHTIEEITLKDVVPLSLGLENVTDNTMKVFIKRNSHIPITVVQDNWSVKSGIGTEGLVVVLQGERLFAIDNKILGKFVFDVGEQTLNRAPKLTFTFFVDANGILHVSGVNRNTNSKVALTIISDKGRLTKVEIEKMKQEFNHMTIA